MKIFKELACWSLLLWWVPVACAEEGVKQFSIRFRTRPEDAVVFQYERDTGALRPLPLLSGGSQVQLKEGQGLHLKFGLRPRILPRPPEMQPIRDDNQTYGLSELLSLPPEKLNRAIDSGVWPPTDQAPFELQFDPKVSRFRNLDLWASRLIWIVPSLLGLTVLVIGALRYSRARPAEPQALSPQTVGAGSQLGRFRLQALLGRGGMGEVYRALDDQGQPVALKVLRGEFSNDPSHQKRFQREIQICSRLNHPNLIRIYDWGQQDDVHYLAMELLEGRSLQERLEEGPIPPEEFAPLAKQIGEALSALHQEDLVHRDIKPENIFLHRNGTVKLMDFGIARSQDLTQATQTGIALGTPAYMAPEQVQGQLNPASDQYSFGVVAFRALTGHRPFEGEDPMAVVFQAVHSPAPKPSSFNPGLSIHVDHVIGRILAKNPRDRYPSALSACMELARALKASPDDEEEATGLVGFGP
ncbi:MAG: serine/threonine protein kinase [Candidatus Eremiobacteraeota bacterium]|nr:serine/threonine protein kinase [Candidatus Eremiobacteraeota bacterium]MCW5867344.1 serine/threonine protein kinase [Candidatus Eremiobacteraeota bacterium]